jgi:AcrR family transcriptional regulator
MSKQEQEVVLEDGLDEATVPHTGGAGVPAAEVPEPVAKSAGKRKADKDGGEKATPKLPGTKAGMIAAMVNVMSGRKMADLQNIYSSMTEETLSDEEAELEAVDLDVTEDIDSLLGEGDFSDEFKANIGTLFQAAVAARIAQDQARLEEEFESKFEESVAEATDSMTEKVDEYLNYAVNEWKEDNEVAIESGIRAELAEDFIKGLHTLFTEHYIEVPEDKVDVVEELATKVEDLEDRLNKQIAENSEMSKVVAEHKAEEIFTAVVEGLADTEAEKMRTFAEGIDYDGDDDFRSKLEVVRENYFPTKAVALEVDEVALEDNEDQESKSSDPVMSMYATAISRTIKK